MEFIKNSVCYLLLIFFCTNEINSQCALDSFAEDINKIEDFIDANGTDAWYVLFKAKSNKAIRQSKNNLELVSNYLEDTKKTVDNLAREIEEAGGFDTWKINNAGGELVTLLAKYGNVRKHLGNSRVTQYFEVEKLKKLSEGIGKGNYKSYEDLLKTANSDVLDVMNKMDEFEFAEMMRGLRDLMNNKKLKTFEEAIKDVTKFDGEYGWLKYWNKTPGLKYAMTTILDLRKAGKLDPVGNATDIQLATIQAFTRSGDFINQAKRYSPEFMGEFAETGWRHAKEGFDELRKVPSRLVKDEVFSGKAFSKSQFEADFINGIGKTIEYKSFISTSKLQSVAEAFTDLTKKWAEDGEKIAVVQRITTKNGVYIDDLSDWGKNLGPTRHSNAEKAIQIQEEVVLKPGLLKQVAEPVPIMENGIHKTINGMKAYFIDFIEVVN